MFKLSNLRLTVQLFFFLITLLSFNLASPFTTRLTILGLLLLVGPYYCGWVCIFGTIQDLIYDKLGKFIPYKLTIPHQYNRYLLWLRYITLFTTIALVTSTLYARGTFYKVLLGKNVPLTLILIMVVFMLLCLITPRPFCRYFCVEGARYSAIGLARIFTITRNPDTCISCGKCNKVCPMGINVAETQSMYVPHCISCGNCISNCPKPNTLKLKIRSFVNWQNLLLFILGVAYTYIFLQRTFAKYGGL